MRVRRFGGCYCRLMLCSDNSKPENLLHEVANSSNFVVDATVIDDAESESSASCRDQEDRPQCTAKVRMPTDSKAGGSIFGERLQVGDTLIVESHAESKAKQAVRSKPEAFCRTGFHFHR
ncbi:hypothetical protein MLD38_002927 [Melastoma candidum]|uniref:Uncharacterized protein n=2 Tax=Melastoma candidum TaxID=119954 RepID=A0ACB9S0K7_9MYRT|nr:hypothetical protein MLD38_002925 [Melastoma candidum]KAI4384824.1 hypothetical protein MLD38_002927 [Melastoma candidum]